MALDARPAPYPPAPAAAALLAALTGHARGALPRTLVVVAHPDDETVGAGACLPRLAAARFAVLTDGAPRDGQDAGRHGLDLAAYARRRREELHAALARCGIEPGQVDWLECPDQQAALRLPALARQLARLYRAHEVQAVLTQPYEGGHPDHDATAFAAHAAAALLRAQGQPAPDLVEMTSYHLGPQGLRAGEFLPAESAPVCTVRLTPQDQAHKRALLACHATQQETLRQFPLEVERFRPAPAYDFTRAPHAGRLHYELYDWGMDGERFRALCAAALEALGLARGEPVADVDSRLRGNDGSALEG